MMAAILITIGDEILSGTTVDTNSNFIAAELKNIGIKVLRIYTISDDIDTIQNTLEIAFQQSDIVLTTGGLGPTKDDRTKIAFCKFFNDQLKLDEKTYHHLSELLKKRKREYLLELNKSQAEIPSRGIVFQNMNGTAPAVMMDEANKIAICMPGVPYEVKPLIKDQIIPYLKHRFKTPFIISRFISVVDFPESLLSQKIESWELSLPSHINLSYLPIANRVKLKLTATGEKELELIKDLDGVIEELRPLINDYIIAESGDKIEEILHDILIKRNLTLSVAESCTGGELSHLINSVSGSSQYFIGSVVPYAKEKKAEILGVSPKTLEKYTVVSEEVAAEMAIGVQKILKTDLAISTTGVAGPTSDEYDNPVGLVYYSILIGKIQKTFRLNLPHLDRKDFMNFVSQKALQSLTQMLVKETADN